MKRIILSICFGILILFILSEPDSKLNISKQEVISHSGGTDKCGCHYNRKTGFYHCHKRKKRGGDCPA